MTVSTVESHRLLTVDEFDRAWAAGVYGPEERLELIEGEVIKKVSPQESPHATATSLCAEAMRVAFGTGYHVRIQLPLLIGQRSKPEPDVAVVTGRIRDYTKHHPSPANTVLVIEVADSTLAYDRQHKSRLYAGAGIQEYWLVNLVERTLEVHRDPTPTSSKFMALGSSYISILHYKDSDTISPLAAPNKDITVSDLLP